MILFHLHWGTQQFPANKWICRGIEVVITRRSWKPFVRKGAWVRIPPSALQLNRNYLNKRQGCFSMKKSCYPGFGEIPKRLKGLPWKGSRSLIAARGFKSLFLRSKLIRDELEKIFWKNLKKLLTKFARHDNLTKLTRTKAKQQTNWNVKRSNKWTLITKQYANMQVL